MYRLCSQNGREGEREKKKNGTVHYMVLIETFLDMSHHFEPTSFAI